MRGRVIRHDQHRSLARPDEITRHTVDEVGGIAAVEVVQVGVDGLFGNLGSLGHKFGSPDVPARIIHRVRECRIAPNRLAEYPGHDPPRGPLH